MNIRWGNENYKTAEGFGVGSPISDVKKSYPGGSEWENAIVSGGKA